MGELLEPLQGIWVFPFGENFNEVSYTVLLYKLQQRSKGQFSYLWVLVPDMRFDFARQRERAYYWCNIT